MFILNSVNRSYSQLLSFTNCPRAQSIVNNVINYCFSKVPSNARSQSLKRKHPIYQAILLSIGCLLTGTLAWADDIVDLYGIQGASAEYIIKKYTDRIRHLELQLSQEYMKEQPNNARFSALIDQKKQLISAIKHEGSFLFVDLQTVAYPKEKNIYTTIEIINHCQPNRVRFINKPTQYYPTSKQHDIVDLMGDFEKKSIRLLITKPTIINKSTCPVYHCITTFNPPELKPYLKIFNQGMSEQKEKIINTLNHDPNPNRRASAAFLMGHNQDPNEIIRLLIPHITDPDSGVRNNVLRVISATIAKKHITSLDPSPFLALLASPYVTDRNKSLSILVTLADATQNQQLIIAKGGDNLINLLRLKQPNNHNLAYIILKKISHKDFGEYHINAWERWVEHSQCDLNKHRHCSKRDPSHDESLLK